MKTVSAGFALAAALTAAISAHGSHAQIASKWETLTTEAYPGKRDDISFADATHGWYGTGKGDLFSTLDGGRTWQQVASKPGTFIRALGFVNARTGFIGNVGTGYYPGVTDPVPLYRTDDGGSTWAPVDLHGTTVAGICAIDILRTQRIFQGRLVPQVTITAAGRVGGPAAIIRSSDGGVTWRVTDMSHWTSMILDVHFVDERIGFVAGATSSDVSTANAQVLMTRDGGRDMGAGLSIETSERTGLEARVPLLPRRLRHRDELRRRKSTQGGCEDRRWGAHVARVAAGRKRRGGRTRHRLRRPDARLGWNDSRRLRDRGRRAFVHDGSHKQGREQVQGRRRRRRREVRVRDWDGGAATEDRACERPPQMNLRSVHRVSPADFTALGSPHPFTSRPGWRVWSGSPPRVTRG